MEAFPPTLDVRFKKDIIIDHVKDRYQYNAYLLGQIFSISKNMPIESDWSESSSDEEDMVSIN